MQLPRGTSTKSSPRRLASPDDRLVDLPPDDQQAIGKTLLTVLTSFRNRDPEALRAVYSADADWVNAFGTVKRGRDEIVDYLRGPFADDNFNRGEPEGPPHASFRVLIPEVVLVSAHLRIKGQGLVGGGTLDRDNFSQRALQHQTDGSWLIVSEMSRMRIPKRRTRNEKMGR